MTPRDRMRKTIAHEQPDFCPYTLSFGGEIRRRLIAHTNDPNFDAGLIHHTASVGPRYPETNERVDDTHYTDAYGVIWEESYPGEIGMVRNPQLKQPSLKDYTFPDTQVPNLFADMPDQLAKHPDRFSYWSLGFSLFERAWTLRGIDRLLMDMVEYPDFVHELLDRICECNLALIDLACQYPIDCVRFGDDWGAQRGLIMGPNYWRTFIKPRFTRMVERAASHGKATFLHSDGDIRDVIPDLIDIGLTILNPVQPDVMDIYDIKREYGRDLTFLGGVSVQQLLPHAAPEGVQSEVRRLIAQIGANGGFIIAPTHSLGRDIPLENLLVLLETFTQQN